MTVLTSIASFSAQTLAFVSLPFYLQGALHRSQVETGLLMTPWPVAAGLAASVAGKTADRYSVAILGGGGLGLLALGLFSIGALADGDDVLGDRRPDGGVRPRLRLLPVAQQPHHAVVGADGAQRRGGRHARHRRA